MAQIVADRKDELHPGRMFVEACAVKGLEASVEYDVTITGSLTSSRRKPRHPARNMLKVVDLSRDPRQFYWHESAAQPGDPDVTDAGLRREAANHFGRSPIPELLTFAEPGIALMAEIYERVVVNLPTNFFLVSV
jgi:hypothetical protein